METDDEKLFSKSAPLLAAAAECAFYTVKCSALNAEELRRENGLEVLYQVIILSTIYFWNNIFDDIELERTKGDEIKNNISVWTS